MLGGDLHPSMFSRMSRNKRTIFMHLGNLRRLLCFDCVLLLLSTDDEDENGSAPMAVKRYPIYRMLQLWWCVMNAVSTLEWKIVFDNIVTTRLNLNRLTLWIWCWWFIGCTFFCWVHACKVRGENEREDNVGYEWCPSILFVTLCYRTNGRSIVRFTIQWSFLLCHFLLRSICYRTTAM